MSRVRTGAVSESGIVFFSSGGHDHNGINSSIIDTSKYSIFDFGFGLVGTNRDRVSKQTINQIAFKDYIIKTVNESVLEPAGVVLQDNIINSRNIIAGSITSVEIAANTITSNNIAAGTITAGDIAANTITGAQIAANTITADKLQVGAISAGSVTIANNGVPNGDFWSSNGSFRLGGANGINYTGSTINLGSNTVITGSIDIGGPDNASLQIDTSGALWVGHRNFGSAPFRVYSNGRVIAGNGGVDIDTNGSLGVTGTTTVGGSLIVNGVTINLGSSISTTTVAGTLTVNSTTTMNNAITVSGTANLNGATTVGGSLVVSNGGTINGGLTVNGLVTVSNDIRRTGFWTLTNAGFSTQAGISIGAQIVVFTGSPSNPAFTFTGFSTDGIYRDSSGAVSITISGAQRAAFSSTRTIFQTETGSGDALFNGPFNIIVRASSSKSLKDNINYTHDGLNKLKQLKPVTFTWKPDPNDAEDVAALRPFLHEHGFIVEDLIEVDRHLVNWHPDINNDMPEEERYAAVYNLDSWKPSSYKTNNILAIAVKAVQELSQQVDALTSRISELEGNL